MAEQVTPNNATGGGQQPDQGSDDRTFTQEDVNRIAGDARAAERKKYADYDDLKDAATKWEAQQESQKSALQRAEEARQAAVQAAKAAMTAANERLTRAAFLAAAAQAGAAHPEDAYALANRATVQVSDDGTVSGVAEAVAVLVEAGRLVMSGRIPAPNLDGGAGGGNRPGDRALDLTPEEAEFARKMNIKPEDYAKQKQKRPRR